MGLWVQPPLSSVRDSVIRAGVDPSPGWPLSQRITSAMTLMSKWEVKLLSRVLLRNLWTGSLPGFSVHRNSPGHSIEVSYFLQGSSWTRGSNPGLPLQCRQTLYLWATRKPQGRPPHFQMRTPLKTGIRTFNTWITANTPTHNKYFI